MNGSNIVVSIFIIAALLLMGSFIFSSFPSSITDNNGIITDKFITSDFHGDPQYYFILDNSTEVYVHVETYYKYSIGDYYPAVINNE